RTSQTQHGNRDAPGAQFTIAGRCGTSVYLSSPTAETDCTKGALQNCATNADSLNQLESQQLSELFINETVRTRIQIERF
ncbi:MAG TPA: hypothetical protein VE056_01850, partial [Pyrinomonadaceae bacterium]|nr:hypothetical protein [Pyrinomonadaceae bacterium]